MPAVPAKIINIDELLEEEFSEDAKAEIAVQSVKLFGHDVRVRLDLNAFNVVRLQNVEEDASVIAKTMTQIIHPDDRALVTRLLAEQERLDIRKLMFLFNTLVEVASGGHPTTSSGDSSTGTRRKAAVKRSAARSSGEASTRRG